MCPVTGSGWLCRKIGVAAGYGVLLVAAACQRTSAPEQYILPNGVFGPGLYGQAMVTAGEAAVGNKMWGGRIGYAAGPFNVAAAYSDTDVSDNVSGSNWNIAGSWDFKIVKLSAFFSRISVDGSVGGVSIADRGQSNWFVGGSMPFGQANFKISYGQVDGTGLLDDLSASQIAFGADYNLSKRTAMYATASFISNDNGSAFRVANTSALSGGNNSTGFEVGVRHSF